MKSTIILRNEHVERDSRHLEARLDEAGDLYIQGQDLGPTVEKFWGPGNNEYEWVIVVRAAHVPQLVAALAGTNKDDVLHLLASRCVEDERIASKAFLDECAIPNEFWSLVGS